MTMKRIAFTLALMMLVGTLATPLLSEIHDEMPLILDEEGTDVMNAGRGSGHEYVGIDHSDMCTNIRMEQRFGIQTRP